MIMKKNEEEKKSEIDLATICIWAAISSIAWYITISWIIYIF
jgi:hypothetical protein